MLSGAVESVVTAIISGLAVTVLFIVPGYLLQVAYLHGMRRVESSDRIFLAKTVVSAILIHAIALPWTLALFDQISVGRRSVSPLELSAWILVVLLATPVLAGAVLGRISRLRSPRWIAHILEFVGIAHHIRVPDAWQYHFSRRQPAYVRVHLKDQRTITGYLGSQSFASSDSVNRDLYLERQYLPESGKLFGPRVPNDAGIWVASDQIAFIEFFRGATSHGHKEEENDEKR